jgi:hypothetical protein
MSRAAARTPSPTRAPARMIFLVSPSGHEHYQKELAELAASTAGPLDTAIAELRARHDIEQLTPQVIPGRLWRRSRVHSLRRDCRLRRTAARSSGPGGRSMPLRNVLGAFPWGRYANRPIGAAVAWRNDHYAAAQNQAICVGGRRAYLLVGCA